MRALVLGGAGGVGRAVARTLATFPVTNQITIADLNQDLASGLQHELGEVAQAVRLDIDDPEALATWSAGHDVVINAIGPYRRSAEQVLTAVVAAGAGVYLDACDDPAVTVRMLDKHSAATAASVCAVVGAGASPGLSNMLAVLAVRELDRIDALHTGWSVDAGEGGFRTSDDLMPASDGRPPIALLAWLERIRDDITVPMGSGGSVVPTMVPRHLEFPGIGSGTAWSSGHPETLTLAASLGISGICDNYMVMRRSTAIRLLQLRERLQAGTMTLDEAALSMIDPTPRQQLEGWFASRRVRGGGALPAFFAIAEGERASRGLRVGVQLNNTPSGLDTTAGVTLALAAQMLVAEGAAEPGVHPPELVLEPEVLLPRLAPYCDPPPYSPERLTDTTIEPI